MRAHREGHLLLPLALALALVAGIAFLMSRESALDVDLVLDELAVEQARYVAEAGYGHTYWWVQRANCGPYGTLPPVPFGPHSYSATITPGQGSPVAIVAVGTLDGGLSRSLARGGVRVNQSPVTLSVQPDPSAGLDAYLDESNPTWNYGAHPVLLVEDKWASSLRHALVRFDVGGLLPEVEILSATLSLYMNGPSADGGPVGLRNVSLGWGEGEGTGSGVPGVSWVDRSAGQPWATPGGDFDATPYGSTTIAAGGVGWYQWDVTSLVRGWVHGALVNQGVALVPDSPGTSAQFASSDDADPRLRPTLNVVYSCECGSGPVHTVTLQPGPIAGKDGWINGSKPLWNFGTHAQLLAIEDAPQRSLVEFDLSFLPAGALVQSAELGLYASQVQSPGPVTVHRVTTPWLEGTCQGSGCTADGATWVTTDGSTPWASPGGDHEPAAEDSRTVTTPFTWTFWDVTDAAADWVGGSQPNHGLLVRTQPGGSVDFVSSDAANPMEHPRLELEFTCPCGVDCSGFGSGPTCLGTFRDEFRDTVYTGSDGTLAWSTDWLEINEGDGAASGDERVTNDLSDLRVTVQDNDGGGEGLEREANLTPFASALLTFDYRRHGLDEPGDYVIVAVSDNGGADWTELDRLEGPADDATYQSATYDISGFRAANTRIRLLSSPTLGGTDSVFFDNVQICVR